MQTTTYQIKDLVYGCKGYTLHLTLGSALLRNGKGFECPHCHSEVSDYSDTPIGREYLALVQPAQTPSPPPRMRIVKNSV